VLSQQLEEREIEPMKQTVHGGGNDYDNVDCGLQYNNNNNNNKIILSQEEA
jgi:hypothetical protein